MRNHRLRWALFCVAAGCGTTPASLAQHSRTIVIQPNDTIERLARKHHTTPKEIARANHISVDAVLIDGKKLRLPSPSRSMSRPATMRRAASPRRDRIVIRSGPSESTHRLTILDRESLLVATRRAGDWIQVTLASGKSGWVRSDLVTLGKSLPAPAHPKQAAKTSRRRPLVAAKKGDKERSEIAKRLARQCALAARHIEKNRAKALAAAGKRRSESRAASLRRHTPRPEADAPNAESSIVRSAYACRGVPYRFGGMSRGGFDCSGFTSYVFRQKGVHLPRTAAEQFSRGKRVPANELRPGDLVFFHTTRAGISHVGIYVGDGKFCHASSGGGSVRVDSLSSGYYKARFRGARRVQ